MTYEKFRFTRYAIVKEHLNTVIDIADQMSALEKELIVKLKTIDENRYYTITGYKSLIGFCCKTLRLTQTQALRIITLVRRAEPIPNTGKNTQATTNKNKQKI